MIRLPTSEEESAALNSTFHNEEDHENEGIRNFRDEDRPNFHDDDDDDIPPSVGQSGKKVKMTENEEDFFDVSDDDNDEEVVQNSARGKGSMGQQRFTRNGVGIGGRGTQDEGTKAWRD